MPVCAMPVCGDASDVPGPGSSVACKLNQIIPPVIAAEEAQGQIAIGANRHDTKVLACASRVLGETFLPPPPITRVRREQREKGCPNKISTKDRAMITGAERGSGRCPVASNLQSANIYHTRFNRNDRLQRDKVGLS
jgi:hypothetical protein